MNRKNVAQQIAKYVIVPLKSEAEEETETLVSDDGLRNQESTHTPSRLIVPAVQIENRMIDVPTMLTVEEAHVAYRLSKQFLYRIAKSGKVHAVRVGNKFLLSAESLTYFLRYSTLIDEQETPIAKGVRPLG